MRHPKKSLRSGVLLMPGGDVGLRRKDGDSFGARSKRRFEDAALASLKGKLSAKLTETREIEGTRCAVIEIEGEIRAQGEFETEEGGQAKFELELDPRGELLWNLEAHRAHALTLTARIRTELNSLEADEDGGETSTFEMREKLAGTMRLEAQFKAP